MYIIITNIIQDKQESFFYSTKHILWSCAKLYFSLFLTKIRRKYWLEGNHNKLRWQLLFSIGQRIEGKRDIIPGRPGAAQWETRAGRGGRWIRPRIDAAGQVGNWYGTQIWENIGRHISNVHTSRRFAHNHHLFYHRTNLAVFACLHGHLAAAVEQCPWQSRVQGPRGAPSIGAGPRSHVLFSHVRRHFVCLYNNGTGINTGRTICRL